MEFSLLSSIEWELINVNSQLVIAKIQEVENVKHAERREKELIKLAEFQVMEFKMALEEKEAVMMETSKEEAGQAREQIELAEFEMLERRFGDEEKLLALEKKVCEERNQNDLNFLQSQNTLKDVASVQHRYIKHTLPISINKGGNPKGCNSILSKPDSNNNNNILIKKVRFAALEKNSAVTTAEQKDEGVICKEVRKYKPPVSRIPKLFKAVLRRKQ